MSTKPIKPAGRQRVAGPSGKPNRQGDRTADVAKQEQIASTGGGSSDYSSTQHDVALAGKRFREPARLVGAQSKIRGYLPIVALTGLSLAAWCLVFPPAGWWWLGFVCLVPWFFCVCTAAKSWFIYLVSWLLGLAFFFIHISWMIPVTLPGYIALCIGYSFFYPLAAWPIRHMHRRHGVSVALSAPIAWVAAEYLRSIGPLGFPFFILGHSQYQNLTLIQISDLTGAYGVSFLLVMINGWLTDLLIQPILIWRSDRATRLPVGSLTTLLVVCGAMIYGSAQRSSTYFHQGPKVAVVQHDFPMYVDERASRTTPGSIFRAFLELTRRAAASKPDLIVLPETAISSYVNSEFIEASPATMEEIRQSRFPYLTIQQLEHSREFSRLVRDKFQAIATETSIPIVLGSSALEWRSKEIPPRVESYNSAFLLKPGEHQPVARYDKIHLVLFGEYVPFRYSYPRVYEWLNAQTPWGQANIEYSLTEGKSYTVFEFDAASQENRRYRAAVPICYEEIMPYIARQFVRGNGTARDRKNIDMLLTISNDGWFLHSAELEQHLASAVFRAVENRIPVARSVNTGASAQIHPDGRIHQLVTLSEPQREKLRHLMEAVEDLRQRVTALGSQASAHEAYLAGLEQLLKAYTERFRSSVEALGAEFDYLDERLSSLVGGLHPNRADARRKALNRLQEQLDSDLAMMRRWLEEPGAAPGFIVAEMKCDDRVTLYTRWGDWFAQGTTVLLGLMLLDWFLRRLGRKRLALAGPSAGGSREE